MFSLAGESLHGTAQNSLPPGPGSNRILPDGSCIAETNIAELWPGVCAEATNGLRVQLYWCCTNEPQPWVDVSVGSLVSNSWGNGYIAPPDETFLRCELRDSTGTLVLWGKRFLVSNLPKKLAINRLGGCFSAFLIRLAEVCRRKPWDGRFHSSKAEPSHGTFCPKATRSMWCNAISPVQRH